MAAASFHSHGQYMYKYWWLHAGQYLDIMLQSVTELNTDWSYELYSTSQGSPIRVARSGTPAHGYLDNPMEFHNSYIGRGFSASITVQTATPTSYAYVHNNTNETLSITFPNGANYGMHSDSTNNPISNAVDDSVFPERYYVAAHKSGTVAYRGIYMDDGTIGVDRGYRIPINSIVPYTPSSVENVQKPWYVNAFVRYHLGVEEETNSDKRALLGNPNTVSGGGGDPRVFFVYRIVFELSSFVILG